MFCPRCAAPIDGVKYCRQCGANVSLVPQAMTGQLPPPSQMSSPMSSPLPPRMPGAPLPPTLFNPDNNGIKEIMIGAAFMLLMLFTKMIWLLIPAFIFLGKGFSKMVTYRNAQSLLHNMMQPQMQVPPQSTVQQPMQFQSPPVFYATPQVTDTNDLPPLHPHPPSVVEGTTRNLDPSSRQPEKNR